MKKGLFFVLFLVSFLGFGQCPTGPINLNSQADIDAFEGTYPNCTNITHGLTINGNDIVNLNGLSNIISIDGNYFHIEDNPLLVNFEGMQNLETIGGNFYVRNNGILNFIGLNSLTQLGTLEVSFNNSLLSFQGLENVITISDQLKIYYNPSLINFEGLNNLQSAEQLIVHDSPSLYDLAGLDNLHTISNLTSIGLNNNMVSLNGLQGLQSAAYMIISNNIALTSIDALSNIEPVRFEILGNSNLSHCAISPVCEQIDIDPNNIIIGGNAQGCNSVPEVEAQCQLTITEADFSDNFSLFPNPVSSTLQIKTSKTISFEKAIIYSTLGKRILETSDKQINLETLSAGIYFVEVVTTKGSVTKKIVKE